MKTSLRNGIVCAAAAAALGSMILSADAAVVTLAGGSPAEGLPLNPSSVVYAVYQNNNSSTTTYVVQGVTFSPMSEAGSPISGVGSETYAGGSDSTAATGSQATFSDFDDLTDNQALVNIMNSGIVYNSNSPGTLNLALKNLTSGQAYVVTIWV